MDQMRVGDPVRFRVTPDVDASLWDEEGFVAGFTRDDRLLVELGDGTDVTAMPDQVDPVDRVDVRDAFRGTAVGPF